MVQVVQVVQGQENQEKAVLAAGPVNQEKAVVSEGRETVVLAVAPVKRIFQKAPASLRKNAKTKVRFYAYG